MALSLKSAAAANIHLVLSRVGCSSLSFSSLCSLESYLSILQSQLQHRQVTELQSEGHESIRITACGVQEDTPHLPAIRPHPRRGAGKGLLRAGHQGQTQHVPTPVSAQAACHTCPQDGSQTKES